MAIQPETDTKSVLFWRDEIPEAMFWLEGEGLGGRVQAGALKRFLPVDVAFDYRDLDALVGEGLLRRTRQGLYELTDEGRTHGARVFADDFDAWRRVGENDCGGANCICWVVPEECQAAGLPPS